MIMSYTSFRVYLHPIVCLNVKEPSAMSRNPLLKEGAYLKFK